MRTEIIYLFNGSVKEIEFAAAVEQGNFEIVKSLLDSTDIDINSLNIAGISLLNIAVIQRHVKIAKILLSNGATDNENQSYHDECKYLKHNFGLQLLKCSTFGNLSPAQMKELENEFHLWEKRYKRFRKLQTDYAKIDTPQPPTVLNIDVISSKAVRIRFQEADNPENSICTKYKVEWRQEDAILEATTQSMEMLDLRKLETVVGDLKTGCRYYFQVSAGNCKGYGRFQTSVPQSVIPSSWRDLAGKIPRYSGKATVFDNIFLEIRQSRPQYGFENQGPGNNKTSQMSCAQGYPDSFQTHSSSNANHYSLQSNYATYHSATLQHQRKNQKIISIKQLFASAPKFQKHFKRGIFLSCVIYSEDRLLVSTEEFLPTIEIDETFPSSLHNDFHWMLKVSTTWEDVKSFKVDMEKSGSASTFHFRLKLLQAAAAMQNALGIVDLGRLYYKTTQNKENSVVIITTINYLRLTKMISSLNVRWIPLTKMISRKSTDDISDVLVNSIQDQILYHQVSNIPVGRGLYLGYLKLASSVDLLKIFVAEKTPNMLPHAKIRDNPHVSGEEWKMIQKLAKSNCLEATNIYEATSGNAGGDGKPFKPVNAGEERTAGRSPISNTVTDIQQLSNQYEAATCEDSEAQDLFRTQIITALKRLFAVLEIDYENSKNHRLYNAEVIEVSNSVSLLVVMPSLENVCLVAGQSDKLLQRHDLIPLPIQVFEMIHLSTYQKEFISRYARLSAILEMDTILAQHTQREAFSTVEMASAKSRMNQLQDLQVKLDSAWKVSRWVIDVVTNSRDKSFVLASVDALVQRDAKANLSESILSDKYLGRSEELQRGKVFSKSDQQLSVAPGIKFSRSDNHLSNFGYSVETSTQNTEGCPDMSPNSAFLRYGAQATRKVSVPSPSEANGAAIQAKVQFSPNIYSSHSQSDSTISNSVLFADTNASETMSSSSLHNLFSPSSGSADKSSYTQKSILSTAELASSSQDGKIVKETQINQSTSRNQGKTNVAGPPPVPPRRTNPTLTTETPQISQAQSQDPLPLPPSVLQTNPTPKELPFVTVNVFDCSAQGNQESTTIASTITSSSVNVGGEVQASSNSSLVRIQVYAAYDCGLSEGTSVKMQISNQTTARQVVHLLVSQLNAEVKAKGLDNPIYERTQDFCLVSVIGARERRLLWKKCLLDDGKLRLPSKTNTAHGWFHVDGQAVSGKILGSVFCIGAAKFEKSFATIFRCSLYNLRTLSMFIHNGLTIDCSINLIFNFSSECPSNASHEYSMGLMPVSLCTLLPSPQEYEREDITRSGIIDDDRDQVCLACRLLRRARDFNPSYKEKLGSGH
ncbi:unnamed protein product [Allacma fusca]|uniref:Fibronectin type-III domain-containing protein n=1 Tax=Allacma fusca TaxID=39272 RepID=A0A8J2PDW2_9HEXA|nr:unnamed protein product [Allacma fusca]